ncbi:MULTISPECIES: hypothetical protein [unclassified Bradyrhizobium]
MNDEQKGKIALADFFIGYSEMDRAVGDAIKSMLKVKAADDDLVVAAVGDFVRRCRIVLAGLKSARTFGGTKAGNLPPLNAKARQDGEKAIKNALDMNDFRVKLAHGYLVQNEDGSFNVTHLKLDHRVVRNSPDHIGVARLQQKTKQMLKVTESVRDLARELSRVVFELEAINLAVGSPRIAMSATLTVNDAGEAEER